jgi:hypothetical protein
MCQCSGHCALQLAVHRFRVYNEVQDMIEMRFRIFGENVIESLCVRVISNKLGVLRMHSANHHSMLLVTKIMACNLLLVTMSWSGKMPFAVMYSI